VPRHLPPRGGAPLGSPAGPVQSIAGASLRRLEASSPRRLPSAIAASMKARTLAAGSALSGAREAELFGDGYD
jgi:hypothetical protein